MGRFIRSLPPWPLGLPLPDGGLFFFYDPATDQEYRVVPAQLGGGQLGQLTSEDLSDATEAGRALLTALDAPAQLRLLDKVTIPATPTHPAFSAVYGTGGALQWLLDRYGELTATPKAPAAPTEGIPDDTANTFSGVLVPGFPALADYEVFGVPGFAGVVSATSAGCDIQSGRLIMRGLTGALGVGTVGMRVAASGNRPAGASLTNAVAFTGATVTPTPTGYATTYAATYPLAS